MQGDFSLVAGVTAYIVLQRLNLPLWLAFLVGSLAGGVLGLLIERFLVQPMRRRGGTEEGFLLLTLGIAFAVSASVLYFFGRDSYVLTGFGGEKSIDVGDAAIRIHAVWLVGLSLVAMLGLRLFYDKTLLGARMMAASIDPGGASTIGISVARMRAYTFMLGGLMGGFAGVLIAPLINIHYEMGLLLTLKGFAAAILGGLGNPFGALLGGLVLALTESMAIAFVSSGYKDVIAMTMLIVIMIVLPNGLLGRRGRLGG
jgi:branched-chain amino acid transport system permease protein